MIEPICRRADDGDLPALTALWQVCFGDPPAVTDAFLARWRGKAIPFAAEREGALLSSLWALPCEIAGERAAYLYAVSTRPDARHEGLASALIAFALRDLEGRGVTRVWLYPADPALHALYRPLGFAPSPSSHRLRLPAAPGEAALLPLTAEEAAVRRAALLRGRNAVGWDADALAFAAENDDGAWYDVGGGIALLCPQEGTLLVPEWLAPDPARAAALAAALGCESASVVLPPWLPQGEPLPPPLARGAAPSYAGPTME